MHELSVLQAVLDELPQHVPAGGELKKLELRVGALEHLDGEVMRSGWAALTQGTKFAGSELVIRVVPVRVRCRSCEREYRPDDVSILICPDCGKACPEVLDGAGLVLHSLHVNMPDESRTTGLPPDKPSPEKT